MQARTSARRPALDSASKPCHKGHGQRKGDLAVTSGVDQPADLSAGVNSVRKSLEFRRGRCLAADPPRRAFTLISRRRHHHFPLFWPGAAASSKRFRFAVPAICIAGLHRVHGATYDRRSQHAGRPATIRDGFFPSLVVEKWASLEALQAHTCSGTAHKENSWHEGVVDCAR
jgi:hypothetical protein